MMRNAGRPDRSRHRHIPGHPDASNGYPTPPPSAGSLPGAWPGTLSPGDLPARPRSMPTPPVSLPILHNGEPAMMGAAEPEFIINLPHQPIFQHSPPPSRAHVALPPPPPIPPRHVLDNGEPSMLGSTEDDTPDRSKHLSRTHELIVPNHAPPRPLFSPFATQLYTVLGLFREADVEELTHPTFPHRVTTIFTEAEEEFRVDPETYNRKYRLLMGELAEYMVFNFQLDTVEYTYLL